MLVITALWHFYSDCPIARLRPVGPYNSLLFVTGHTSNSFWNAISFAPPNRLNSFDVDNKKLRKKKNITKCERVRESSLMLQTEHTRKIFHSYNMSQNHTFHMHSLTHSSLSLAPYILKSWGNRKKNGVPQDHCVTFARTVRIDVWAYREHALHRFYADAADINECHGWCDVCAQCNVRIV